MSEIIALRIKLRDLEIALRTSQNALLIEQNRNKILEDKLQSLLKEG